MVYNCFCTTSAEMKNHSAKPKILYHLGLYRKSLPTTLSWSLVCVLCIEQASN